MAICNAEDVLAYSELAKSTPIFDVEHPLTPPRSSASSQTVVQSHVRHEKPPHSSLVELAEEVLSNARNLSEYYAAHSLPQPSFDLDGAEDYSNDLPDEIQEVRAKLRGATADMQILAAGPKENIMWMAWGYYDVSLLHYISHFKIAEAVPIHGTIAMEDVSVLYVVLHFTSPNINFTSACVCH